MAYSNSKLASRFSRRGTFQSNSPLTNEQIARVAPSILATDKHESRSARYAYIPTFEVLDRLRKEGFEPFHVAQCKTRQEGRQGFTKHFMRLRHASQLAAGSALPDGRRGHFEVIVINAHDGTAGWQMLAGWFESVCSNGLIIGTTSEDIRIRHSGRAVEQVIEGAHQVLAHSEVVSEQRREMAALQLSSGEQRAFAAAAMEYRFADAVADNRPMPVEVDQVLEARRYDDAGSDLWSTFNRVQENVIRGGLRKQANPRRREFTRPVTGVDGDVKLNRALWRLAEEMRAIKGGSAVAA